MSEQERKRKHECLLKRIAIKMIEWNYDKKQIAAMLHMSPATYYNRLNNPDSFTYRELQALFYYLKFSPEEREQVL